MAWSRSCSLPLLLPGSLDPDDQSDADFLSASLSVTHTHVLSAAPSPADTVASNVAEHKSSRQETYSKRVEIRANQITSDTECEENEAREGTLG